MGIPVQAPHTSRPVTDLGEAIGKALDGGSGAAGTSCENLGVGVQVGAPRATAKRAS